MDLSKSCNNYYVTSPSEKHLGQMMMDLEMAGGGAGVPPARLCPIPWALFVADPSLWRACTPPQNLHSPFAGREGRFGVPQSGGRAQGSPAKSPGLLKAVKG